MASRVPYESAARTLTQTKRSFAGYVVRQGLAIVLEHNFMMSEKGRENFRNQLQQLVGSIQYTNDLDVHVALVLAPSYQKTMRERYYIEDKSPTQVCREFVDLFGFVQKNQNALDILIEEGKAQLKTWGGPMPDFLLCNSKLTFQLTMTPEKTSYVTQGIDGVKRLRTGPDITSYRGINIIHSRCFSMDPGTPPRDILRRRVRVAEYYRILPHKDNWRREFQFYNEERDTWFTLSFKDLLKMAMYNPSVLGGNNHQDIQDAYRLLASQHSTPDQPDPAHNSTVTNRLMTQKQNTTIPRAPTARLGAPYLGLNIDEVDEHSEQDLLCNVIVSAADSTWANWEPRGEFVTEKHFFAIGAMSWMDFFVRNTNTMAVKPRDDLGEMLAGGAAAAAVPLNQYVYIPPDKYYFESYGNHVDWDVQGNNRPYGEQQCRAYRNALEKSNLSPLNTWMEFANREYDGINVGTNVFINVPAAANRVENAYKEQVGVSLALLFQSICEYPRNTNKYINNTNESRPGRLGTHHEVVDIDLTSGPADR